MAYRKLYKVVVDSPIGYQTINQMADNAADLRTQMLVEHGDREFFQAFGGAVGVDYLALGRHELDEVPRSVGYATTFTQTDSTIGVQYRWAGAGIPFVWKVGTGDYILPVVGLSTFWAKVSQSADDNSVTFLEPRVRPYYATAANGNNAGLRVCTFALDSGDFIPRDMSFGIALYGAP